MQPLSYSTDLPASAAGFRSATWDEIAPFYNELGRGLLTAARAPAWLERWSRLEELVDEAGNLAFIAYSSNTADEDAEAEHLRFVTRIVPRQAEQRVRLARRWLAIEHATPLLDTTRRRLQADVAVFRPENEAALAELAALEARYQKLMGSISVPWDGQPRALSQLLPLLASPDRAVRERAFLAETEACLERRDQLVEIFDRMVALRGLVARSAGFPNFRDYIFTARHRFDYTPADCARLRDAVERVVVPALAHLYRERRRLLGVTSLRPWDLRVDPRAETPLAPFRTGEELVARTRRTFDRMDPQLGGWFARVVEDGLYDIEAHSNKAPGAFCASLSSRRLPFLSMSAVGVASDVTTMLHESGHGFHEFATAHLPLFWHRTPSLEAAELASMSMELLAAPHLDDLGGFYSSADAAHARLAHLEEILLKLAYVASVDAFQDWIYTNPAGADAVARDEHWVALQQRFEPVVDWSDLERNRTARWYRQQHIFRYPLYYIEYGIAQLGALQIWMHSLTEPEAALARYKQALSLGATVSLPEMYRAAGADLVFDAGRLETLITKLVGEIELLWTAQ